MTHHKALDREIARTLELMAKSKWVTSDEYEELTERLEQLMMLKQRTRTPWVCPDKLLEAGVNLAGIGLILNYEKLGVISTKALGFVKKLHF